MQTNSREVRESPSSHREQQTCGKCCPRSLEEDHGSRCKCSNTFMDNKVPKQLCQNPDRRSWLTERVDNQKSTKLPNRARSLPAPSCEPQDLMFQGAASAARGRAWSTNTEQGQRCLAKNKAQSAEIKATRERSTQHCWGWARKQNLNPK